MYTLDTNAIIYYLAGEPEAGALLDDFFRRGTPFYVSTVTVAELFSRRNMGSAEKDVIERLLGSLLVIPVDMEVARAAGNLRSGYRLKIADSLIAATALSLNTTLITRNVVDFECIGTLRLLKI